MRENYALHVDIFEEIPQPARASCGSSPRRAQGMEHSRTSRSPTLARVSWREGGKVRNAHLGTCAKDGCRGRPARDLANEGEGPGHHLLVSIADVAQSKRSGGR
jgi:hypothetical protein